MSAGRYIVCPACEAFTPAAEAVQLECWCCTHLNGLFCRACVDKAHPGVWPTARPGWPPSVTLFPLPPAN